MLSSGIVSDVQFVRVRLDSKGRISIPAFLRRNFGMGGNCELVLGYRLKYNSVILIPNANGQDSVTASTRACGTAFRATASSKAVERKPVQRVLSQGSIPLSDPKKQMLIRNPNKIIK